MSGRASRDKGARGERRACALLARITGGDWIRAGGGEDQPRGDVIPAGTVPEPWDRAFVEVKSHRAVRAEHLLVPSALVLGWWARASAQAEAAGRWPLLVVWLHGRGGAVVLSRRCPGWSEASWQAEHAGGGTWTAAAEWGLEPVRIVGVAG